MTYHSFVALPVVAALVCPASPAQAYSADARDFLTGVSDIANSGTPGQLALFSDSCFAIVLGQSGQLKAPIAAAGTAKAANGKEIRVVAFTHSWASESQASVGSTGKLLQNVARWAGGSKPDPVIGMLGCDLTTTFTAAGFKPVTLRGGDKLSGELAEKRCDVVFCGKDISPAEQRALEGFTKAGHGFVGFYCPWGWAQVRSKPVAAHPYNGIFALVGMAYTPETVGPTITTKDRLKEHEEMRQGYDCLQVPGPEYNAWNALDMLIEANEGKRVLDSATARQAGASVLLASRNLPKGETAFRGRVATLSAAGSAIPSPEKPLNDNKPLDRALLGARLSELMTADPAQRGPHPAAASFPGSVPDSAPSTSASIEVCPSREGKGAWQNTGLYAPPGKPLRITVTNGTKVDGVSVRIGCHEDDLWHLSEWKRVPQITTVESIVYPTTNTANPFGGLVYFQIDNPKTPNFIVTIDGAIAAPYFQLGTTSNADWNAMVSRPAPWAELTTGPGGITLTIPTDVARKIKDPTAIMEHWAKVQVAAAELAAWPAPAPGIRGQRFVADVQISAGYMHSGYPIMTHLDAASFMTDTNGLTEHGWGPYHELGHNHQSPLWTFEGTTEVTCNIFTLYVLETVCGVNDAEKARVLNDEGSAKRARYLAEGAKFEAWKADPFLALQMYAMVKRDFGWKPFKAVFAEYERLAPAERPKVDAAKRDQWMVRLSKAINKNLGPFFQAWGVPTSDAARQSIADLPAWMPADMHATPMIDKKPAKKPDK